MSSELKAASLMLLASKVINVLNLIGKSILLFRAFTSAYQTTTKKQQTNKYENAHYPITQKKKGHIPKGINLLFHAPVNSA